MSQGLELLTGKVRRRRYRYYTFGIITIIALALAGITGFMIYGETEAGWASIQSSLFLSFAILLLFLVPTRDMRRVEAIIVLASEHGGTLKVETVRQELGLPEDKILALLGWMKKQKMVDQREQTDRWVFPELRRGRNE
jgi:MFS family permease